MPATGVRRYNAHIRFSTDVLAGHAASLRTGREYSLETFPDYRKAVTVATDLIKLEPFNDNGFFLRAVAHDRAWLISESNLMTT